MQYDAVAEALADPAFRPRALFERFGIEVLATTEGALDPPAHHRAIRESGWAGRVVTTYRPDAVTDSEFDGFAADLGALGEITGADPGAWEGYLEAHRSRRAFFRAHDATATDYDVPDAATADLAPEEEAALYERVRRGHAPAGDAALSRARTLTEMARMSAEDGMVMQIHPGAWRNHAPSVLARVGRDQGFDIPTRFDDVRALKPMLDAVGMDPRVTNILLTLDRSAYASGLAPSRAPTSRSGSGRPGGWSGTRRRPAPWRR